MKTALKLFLSLFLAFVAIPSIVAQDAQLSFDDWVAELRAEAAALGISEQTLLALDDLEAPLERVLELDNSQPEFVQTFTRYLNLRVTNAQVSRGQNLLQQHALLLEEVRQRYGVQPHYLAAFWAIESNFGRATGGFSVLQALATLAYDPRRADFFRNELLTALQIIDDGHIAAQAMSGSWAGAMGQLQFMPSIFFLHGIDGDGDGRIDIWNSLPDIFHSAANFLSKSGWQGDERWGREVLLPNNFDYSLSGTRSRKSLQEWSDLGVRHVSGSPLPIADMQGSVILPAGANGPAFLAYGNFRATMTYNPSTFYALTVGHLADRFSGGSEIVNMPENEQAMSLADVKELQEALNSRGFDSGEPDGRVGRMTRAAIRAYQEQAELPMDGYASHQVLDTLRN
ncbi:MAG: lytic murein transglycosylase [Gammaproteobacteria bacterium]|jgi:membrane-bound lytic murein transglycosylase B|nr:lytic murein transglycosylase [Gammaproteobacteria bacterium]MBT3859215.1 lytic murein transglycosylase [Gammaproteobacteria bacterium]MBT3988083.1 lytic murein transglycosylase [Gammaproteobacteria bacterium]MBT4583014.1 lytic murein transglycosylase [Gammaproteobacteria bacterium]MBT4658811.1 lytic murein transglycosylase [Gammaproteobacteria bacterium]